MCKRDTALTFELISAQVEVIETLKVAQLQRNIACRRGSKANNSTSWFPQIKRYESYKYWTGLLAHVPLPYQKLSYTRGIAMGAVH